ncbi:MAG: hypothetical protein FVQ79_11815 [Planctomycetes bacterium]|nr:hypothetical protein [Planctomycetota bacterium]
MGKRIITPYEEIRGSLQTGDVIICEQKNFVMKWIGHNAGVYVNGAGQVMVLESTSVSNLTGTKGVQLNPMGLWLAAYPGHVGIRRRRFVNPYIEADRELAKYPIQFHTEVFIKKFRGTSYPNLKTRAGRWYLIRAAWDSIFLKKASTNVETDAWIFCTDLIGRWYRWMGMIPAGANCAELEPDNMYEGEYFDVMLNHPEDSEMQSKLEPIIWIK